MQPTPVYYKFLNKKKIMVLFNHTRWCSHNICAVILAILTFIIAKDKSKK